jgi:hypothetical protein
MPRSPFHRRNPNTPSFDCHIQTGRLNVSILAALFGMGFFTKILAPLSGRLRRSLRELSPYAALFVLALPLLIIEPLKLVAAVIFGGGHWLLGLLVLLIAYALSIFIVERLFHVVKPKLIRLAWFGALWKMAIALRKKTRNWIRDRATRHFGARYNR